MLIKQSQISDVLGLFAQARSLGDGLIRQRDGEVRRQARIVSTHTQSIKRGWQECEFFDKAILKSIHGDFIGRIAGLGDQHLAVSAID